MKSKLLEESKRVFKPEFLNRLDDLIVFRSLNREDMAKIVRDHPIREWGEKLAPFVQEANRQDPQSPTCPWDATLAGLHLLLG